MTQNTNKLATATMKKDQRVEERKKEDGAPGEEVEEDAGLVLPAKVSERSLTTLFWLHVATETSP